MSLPPYPTPAHQNFNGPRSGLYPLRPLSIGEIFGAAFAVTKKHLAVLAPVALVISAFALAVEFAILGANGSLQDFATGRYASLPAGPTQAELDAVVTRLWQDILPAVGISSLISLIGAPILAGIATPFAARGATSTDGTNGIGLARLRGRWGALLGIGLVVGLAIAVGTVLLIVPGIMVWLILLPAGPVVAMEGSSIRDSLARAAVVSKGFRGRLLGVNLLAALIAGAIGLVVASIVGRLVGTDDAVAHLMITQAVTLLVSCMTTAWSSCVVAMLYIDIRMRREGLAQALAAAAGPSPFS